MADSKPAKAVKKAPAPKAEPKVDPRVAELEDEVKALREELREALVQVAQVGGANSVAALERARALQPEE